MSHNMYYLLKLKMEVKNMKKKNTSLPVHHTALAVPRGFNNPQFAVRGYDLRGDISLGVATVYEYHNLWWYVLTVANSSMNSLGFFSFQNLEASMLYDLRFYHFRIVRNYPLSNYAVLEVLKNA